MFKPELHLGSLKLFAATEIRLDAVIQIGPKRKQGSSVYFASFNKETKIHSLVFVLLSALKCGDMK